MNETESDISSVKGDQSVGGCFANGLSDGLQI